MRTERPGRRETLTAVWTLEHGKYVHGARFCDRLAEHPEHLLVAESGCDALCGEARRVVQPELEPARASGPRAYLVAHGEQGEALAVGVADVRARRGEDDVERRVCRRRDAERGSGADKGGSDVQAAPSRSRDPARLDCNEALDED